MKRTLSTKGIDATPPRKKGNTKYKKRPYPSSSYAKVTSTKETIEKDNNELIEIMSNVEDPLPGAEEAEEMMNSQCEALMKSNEEEKEKEKEKEKGKKPKKPRQPAYNRRAKCDEEKAKQYQDSAPKTQDNQWLLVKDHVPTNEIREELLKYSHTCCNWGVEKFQLFEDLKEVFPIVKSLNKENPFKTLEFPIKEFPPSYKETSDYCATSTFKRGCRSNLCKKAIPKCTASIKICYRSQSRGNTCDIFFRGSHSSQYYQSLENLDPLPKVLKEVKMLIDSNIKATTIETI
jgi:hypothetical protein